MKKHLKELNQAKKPWGKLKKHRKKIKPKKIKKLSKEEIDLLQSRQREEMEWMERVDPDKRMGKAMYGY